MKALFRSPKHCVLWLACLLAVFALGCRSTDNENTSERPWDRPTRAEESADWPFGRDNYTDPSRGTYR